MRSLYLRIIITFTFGLVCASAALLLISARISRRAAGDFFEGSMTLELRQAQTIYETSGSQGLAKYLAETDEVLKGRRYLTDPNGRDLVSGADRSKTNPAGFNFLGFPKATHGEFVIVKSSPDGRYRLVVIAPPPLGLTRFTPYFLSLGLAIALLGWALSAGIISPLHRLANAVDCFGRGDLSARVVWDRKDEIGNLARSFNSMADRIETLLTAEKRLLQDVSHELRSPLARLSFAVELVKNTPDLETATSRMRREIKRLSSLVSTLLDVTSAESDPSSRRSERIVVATLVEEVVGDCLLEAEARGVRVESRMNCIAAAVDGNAELLRRAVENVLRNAIRFAPAASAVLIQIEVLDDAVLLRVRDCGPGVPEALLGRIFDPFFRVDESRDGAAGAGLGLSIARRAVLLHGGKIKAENAKPGLVVTIQIPCIGVPSSLTVLH